MLVTKELTFRWGVCPGLLGWNPVVTRGPQTDEAGGEVGDSRKSDPSLTGLGQDQEHGGLWNLRTIPGWQR